MRPAWFPDWTGECVAIVASGPSTRKQDVALLRDRIHVIAIKKNIELCPWADAVYGCDGAWWRSVRGLPDYKGLKMSWEEGGCRSFPDIKPVRIVKTDDRILTECPGAVGSGGNSAFQALNLAAQFGATGILGIGFDMTDRGGAHWYGRNNWLGANNPSDNNFERWVRSFEAAAPVLAAMNIDFVNASPASALRCFRRASIEQALSDWGL